MTRPALPRLPLGLLSAAALALALAASAQNLKPVPQEDVDTLNALVGTAPTAKPAKARRILVFWRCEGFVHGKGIEYGNQAIASAASRTKAYHADFSSDYADLRRANLDTYDAVVLNNTTQLNTQEHRFIEPDLIAYVRSGKGLAVIHAGADNFYKAEQAAEMVGGRFWGHPWGSGGTWAFKLDEPAHPLNRAFGGKSFTFGDEIYQQQSPFYNRAKLRVLVSLDLSHKATADASGQRRADNDYAVSWIRPYGKGRVFYTSFAHDQRAFLDKPVLSHILDGIQYAIGDLKADDTPAGLSPADLALVKNASDADANAAFALLQDILAHTGHPATDAANRAKLDALLKDPSTTPSGKKTILRAMLATGAPADLAPVAACLAAPETREWAAALLAAAPGKAADALLARQLAAAAPELRVTLINALAIRKNAAAVAPYAADKDTSTAIAALTALGRIGDETALAALAKPAPAALEPHRLTALAACLGTLADSPDPRAAARAAKSCFDNKTHPAPLRAAAAKALLKASPAFFADGMKDTCPMVRQTLVRGADTVPLKTLADALKSASPADQAALAAKLAARDAKAHAADLAALLASPDETVVCETLRALTALGGPEHLPAILALASRDGAVGAAARDALTDYRAPRAGEALFDLARDTPDQQTRLLPILGDRMQHALIPQFEPFLTSAQTDVRREAWKALGKSADDRAFAPLVAWLRLLQDPEANQAEAAIRAVAKNVEPPARTATLAAAWPAANLPAKKALANLMSGYPDPAFIAPLSGALADPDKGLRETVLRALSDWPDMAPFPTLKDALASQTDPGLKTVAMRAAVKLATANAGADTRARLLDLFKAAPDDRCRNTAAEALFNADGLAFFAAMQGLFADPACGPHAKKTYVAFFDAKLKAQSGAPGRDLDPKKWKANASHAGNDAGRAIDRNPGSRWSSNRASESGMWFTLDLGENLFISEVILDTEKSGGDTPNGYEVFASHDGKAWTGPVAKGDGNTRGKTVIPLAVNTRHLKFVTTGGRPGLHWSIHEIHVKTGFDQKLIEELAKTADTLR